MTNDEQRAEFDEATRYAIAHQGDWVGCMEILQRAATAAADGRVEAMPCYGIWHGRAISEDCFNRKPVVFCPRCAAIRKLTGKGEPTDD